MVSGLVPAAFAACDAIPGAQGRFRGSRGIVDRPFARPGDTVEVGGDADCSDASPRVVDASSVVTIVFRPPHGPSNAVVIAPSCATILAERTACEAELGGGSLTCVSAAAAGLEVVTRAGAPRARFRFPDTDAILSDAADVATRSDGRGFAGPAAIAITASSAPLPCGLATTACAQQPGVTACIDDLLLDDGACGTLRHPVFDQFTALPPAADFGALCSDPSPPCSGDADELQAAVDGAGNLLVPMDWRRVLVRRSDVPVPRLLRGSIRLEAFEGTGLPLRAPDATVLGAFSVQGAPLPPIFTPQRDPSDETRLTLFGSSDAPVAVLRIARRPTCEGGPRAGLPCQRADDCTPGTCGGGLFDFGARTFAGVGPLVLRRNTCLGGATPLAACTSNSECAGGACVTFDARADDPVPLDGLNSTAGGFAFVVNEALVGQDRDGDGDQTDDVVQLIDAVSGHVLPVGDAGASGRAIVRLYAPPFSRPSLVTAGDTVAVLEPEALAGNRDANGDGDRADTILHAYRLRETHAEDLTPGQSLVADAAPLINGESIALAGGRLWFRTPEAAAARRTTEVVSLDYRGLPVSEPCILSTPQSLSADGRFATFLSLADSVTPDDFHCEPSGLCRDAFLLDRDADGNGRFDEPGGTAVVRVSAGERFSPASVSAVSADGRVVAFVSLAATLVPGDTNDLPDAFVYDRDTGTVIRVSVSADGREANRGVVDARGAIALSADGMTVAFASASSTLVVDDHNDVADVFVHDRRTGITERVSLADDGREGAGAAFVAGLSGVSLSGDGRLVAFDSNASNLVGGDRNDTSDVFVHDRMSRRTWRISVGVRDEEANAGSRAPVMSADGSAVAFTSFATNLVPGVTAPVSNVYVHELRSGVTTVASVASDGTPADGSSSEPSFSADGRFMTFSSAASTLVADDRNAIPDVFVRDRLTGLTERVSLTAGGEELPQIESRSESVTPSLSGDGRSAVFVCTEDLVPGVQRHRAMFTRTADSADVGADLTGDGHHRATVLRELDLDAPAGTPPRTLCPASTVVARGAVVAFLRPELEGAAADCPSSASASRPSDLNDDGDELDQIVHRSVGDGAVESLGLAATGLALSDSRLVALVSEAAHGGRDLNGDSDAEDLVVFVHDAVGGTGWTNLGVAADTIEVRGDVVLAIVPEAGQRVDGNSDGDRADRVLYRWSADRGVESLGLAVEEIVASDTLVAFRATENAQGGRDLNGDGDALDDVLFVYDLTRSLLLPTGQAVTPCRLEACDPRLPYRPLTSTVRFLTLEAAQADDLNADGDVDDLVLQTFNVRHDAATSAGGRRRNEPNGRARTLAAVAAGVCASDGLACADDLSCPRGDRCIVPPGRCAANGGVPCIPGNPIACAPDEFCSTDPDRPSTPTCRRLGADCRADVDCLGSGRCRGQGQQVQRLAVPLGDRAHDVVAAVGQCVEPGSGAALGACRTDDECPVGTACRDDLVSTAIVDRDGDELPDAVDTCPEVSDPAQVDSDGDGVGDACDRRTAGNGRREAGEECDGDDDAVCPGQCQRDATCYCTNELRGAAGVHLRRRAGGIAARTQVTLGEYEGEPLLLRVNDASGRMVASGAADGFVRVGRRAWRATRRTAGLDRVVIEQRHDGVYRITLRARGFVPRSASAPLRVTFTVASRCFAAIAGGPPTTTTATATSTTTTQSASTTTVATSSTTTTTIAPGCCGAHRMVIETTEGGTFELGSLGVRFALPAGTRLVLDVGPPDAKCRHAITVPPGGFEMPAFCAIPRAFTADLFARGCAAGDALGAGTLWDGGSAAPDPDIGVVADTSDGICNPPAERCLQQEDGAGGNVLGSTEVVIGDGVANPVGMHLAVSIPIEQRLWDVQEHDGEAPVCPDPDGLSLVDERVATTHTMLRLTTGRASARFADQNADSCSRAPDTGDPTGAKDGAPAPGPCCVVGQRLTLATASPEFTGEGFFGDVIAKATFPARVVECAPAVEVPAACDALSGGGRVVTSFGPGFDEIRQLFAIADDRLLAVGTASVREVDRIGIGLARYDADGRLDPSFGPSRSGRAAIDLGRQIFVTSAAMDDQGRILVVGFDPLIDGFGGMDDAVVARVLPDGRLDESFGDAGRVFRSYASEDEFKAVAVDPSGRIVTAGYVLRQEADGGDGSYSILVARFDAMGHPDPTFGTNGIVFTDLPGFVRANDRGEALLIQSSGRIIVGGTTLIGRAGNDLGNTDVVLVAYDERGNLDPSFGQGGFVRTDFGTWRDEDARLLDLGSDGFVVGVSIAQYEMAEAKEAAMARYSVDGRLDQRFGVGGIVRTAVRPGENDHVAALALQPGGGLLVGGVGSDAQNQTPAGEQYVRQSRAWVRRYDLTSGLLDVTFGQSGLATTSFGGHDDHWNTLLPLPDGRILGAGVYNAPGGFNGDFGLARYRRDGRIDPSFGGQCAWEKEPRITVVK